MAENSKIQWTHHTFNPWVGCTKVHTGCASCYAEELMANRYHRVEWGDKGTRSKTKTWGDPPRWNRAAAEAGERHRVFCASLADVFEQRGELAPWRAELFQLIDRCRNLDWLLLTKRPENVPAMWHTQTHYDAQGKRWGASEPTRAEFRRDNVWLGTSISDQKTADEWGGRLVKLRPYAKYLFLSLEPMVGDVTLRGIVSPPCGGDVRSGHLCSLCQGWKPLVDWVIIGGESKQGKAEPRRFFLSWARSVIAECRAEGVPVFMKQFGSNVFDTHQSEDAAGCHRLTFKDKHAGEWEEWEEQYRIREFPR